MAFPSTPYALGHFLLRAGLAFALLYPPIAALYDPIAWSAYFPDVVRDLPIDTLLLLHAFGAIEVVLALWLLLGSAIRFPAILAGLILLAIVFVNANDFGILFRDVALASVAFGLALLPAPRNPERA